MAIFVSKVYHITCDKGEKLQRNDQFIVDL